MRGLPLKVSAYDAGR